MLKSREKTVLLPDVMFGFPSLKLFPKEFRVKLVQLESYFFRYCCDFLQKPEMTDKQLRKSRNIPGNYGFIIFDFISFCCNSDRSNRKDPKCSQNSCTGHSFHFELFTGNWNFQIFFRFYLNKFSRADQNCMTFVNDAIRPMLHTVIEKHNKNSAKCSHFFTSV